MKWEDACFFSPFFQESSFVLSWHVGCRTPRVGKIACAPLAASVRISFQETQLETSVLLSCSFLVCLLIIPVCAWTVKPSLAILWVFLLPSARYTKLWEKETGGLKSQQLCKRSWQEDLFYICKYMTLLLQSVRRKKDRKQKAFSWWMEM